MHVLDPMAWEFWVRVGTALACGGAIGLERQLRGKPAGIRTSILICLGTVIFVQLGLAVTDAGSDPTRIIGQVVTGVGFLGAGVIMAREGIVRGMTSASVIWVLAGIGAMIGLDLLPAAAAMTAVALAVLIGVEVMERSMRSMRSGVHSHEPRRRRDDLGDG
jgi:putative Mg2+ transporter-C (MgtC) family protein